MSSASHIRATVWVHTAPLLIQISAVCLARHYRIAKILGILSLMKKTQMQLLAPRCSEAQHQPSWPMGSEPVDGVHFSPSLCLSLSLCHASFKINKINPFLNNTIQFLNYDSVHGNLIIKFSFSLSKFVTE